MTELVHTIKLRHGALPDLPEGNSIAEVCHGFLKIMCDGCREIRSLVHAKLFLQAKNFWRFTIDVAIMFSNVHSVSWEDISHRMTSRCHAALKKAIPLFITFSDPAFVDTTHNDFLAHICVQGPTFSQKVKETIARLWHDSTKTGIRNEPALCLIFNNRINALCTALILQSGGEASRKAVGDLRQQIIMDAAWGAGQSC